MTEVLVVSFLPSELGYLNLLLVCCSTLQYSVVLYGFAQFGFYDRKIVRRGKNQDKEGNFTKRADSNQDDVDIVAISYVAWSGTRLCKRILCWVQIF